MHLKMALHVQHRIRLWILIVSSRNLFRSMFKLVTLKTVCIASKSHQLFLGSQSLFEFIVTSLSHLWLLQLIFCKLCLVKAHCIDFTKIVEIVFYYL
jgi:hypothetical protein